MKSETPQQEKKPAATSICCKPTIRKFPRHDLFFQGINYSHTIQYNSDYLCKDNSIQQLAHQGNGKGLSPSRAELEAHRDAPRRSDLLFLPPRPPPLHMLLLLLLFNINFLCIP